MSASLNLPPQIEIVDQPLDTQMTISMGPQHPSTHGVLRVELVLDGEMVVKATPDIGYLHTGMEKLFEYKKYQQGIVITDRMDYLNPLGNNLAYVMAGEKLLQIEIPERAQTIRVLMCELQRIASHLVWLGTHALDLGAMTVFFYCFREREKILNLIEAASGGRLTPSYFRIGGLMMDLPSGFERRVKQFQADFLNALGGRVRRLESDVHTIEVDGVARGSLHGAHVDVIPDRVEAGSFAMAAAVTGGELFLEGARADHLGAFLEACRKTGIDVACEAGGIRVGGKPPFRVRGDLGLGPDLTVADRMGYPNAVARQGVDDAAVDRDRPPDRITVDWRDQPGTGVTTKLCGCGLRANRLCAPIPSAALGRVEGATDELAPAFGAGCQC